MGRSLKVWCIGVLCGMVASALSTPSVAAAPGDPAVPGLTLTVHSGTNSTTFAMKLPTTDNGCPGNALADGYRWQQYLVSASVNPGTLSYTTSGPVLPAGAPAGSIAQPMYSTTGTPQVNKITLGTAAPHAITGTATLNLDVNRQAGLVDGDYKIGFACSKAGVTHKFWETTITVAAPPPAPSAVLYWAAYPGLVPAAPTGLTAVGTTLHGSTITGAFNPVVTAVPSVSTYTVVATPAGGGAAVTTSVPGTGPYTFSLSVPNSPPLYDVSVAATNSVGTGPAATVANVDVTPSRVVVQDITVTRPAGALVVTQRCGVYGSAIAYSDNVFGSLPLLPAVPATADPDNDNGTAGDPADDFYDTLPGGSAPKNDSLPFNPNAGVTTDDGLFPQYPYPVDANGDSIATYPTNCGITLDTPRLITSGPKAGQYFRTTGRIAQLTVVNTQNIDGGWTLNGTMGNFSNGTDSFSGNLMGWDPEVTWDSLANLDGYDMEAVAGSRRQPVTASSSTGLGAGFNATNTVLASSLAQSAPGASSGMAVMDARLRLLVPVAADSGTFTGALTFTII